MKKYVKPELFYERYELTEQIADCAWEANYEGGNGSCTMTGDPNNGLGGLVVFTSEAQGCNILNPGEEIYCYNNGSGGFNAFVS